MTLANDKLTITKEKRFENCLICLFRPSLYFGYTGITPLKFSCDHSQRPVAFTFGKSWVSLSIATVLLIINLIVGYLKIRILFESRMDTREDFLHVIAIAIHFLGAYLFWVGVKIGSDMKMTELRGISEVTSYCETVGFILFEESFVRMAHYVIYGFIALFLSLECFVIAIFSFKGDFSSKAFHKLWTSTCVFMQGTISTHFMMLQMVLLHMLQRILAQIKLTMDNRLNANAKPRHEQQPFLLRIRVLHRIYESAYLNFIQIEKFINPAFLIWWNTILTINIVCAYLVLNAFMIQEPLETEQVFLILQHCATLAGLTIFLIIMEIIANVVSRLQFVFICEFCVLLLFPYYCGIYILKI